MLPQKLDSRAIICRGAQECRNGERWGYLKEEIWLEYRKSPFFWESRQECPLLKHTPLHYPRNVSINPFIIPDHQGYEHPPPPSPLARVRRLMLWRNEWYAILHFSIGMDLFLRYIYNNETSGYRGWKLKQKEKKTKQHTCECKWSATSWCDCERRIFT